MLIQPSIDSAAEVTEWSVEPLVYGQFLAAIFDEWVRKDVGRIFVQQFDVALESWMGMEPSLCVFRKTCGSALAMEHTGDLYSCDHFVYPENKLGNIAESDLPMAAQRSRKDLASISESLPRMCRNCDVRFACNGECPKHRFLRTPDGESGLNYFCAGTQLFHHVDPYMQFMATALAKTPARQYHADCWIFVMKSFFAGSSMMGEGL